MHEPYLFGLFVTVGLVDTKGINPQHAFSCWMSQVQQGIMEISPDRDIVPRTSQLIFDGVVSPGVR
jgi:hypothetical protein